MLDYFFLPLLLWVAGAAAVADWRTGKIPNRLLLLGLLFGAEALLVQTVWHGLGGPGPSVVMRQAGVSSYVGLVALNGALAFALSLALWWFGVWAAGDAKLFSLLALLTPHGFYDKNLLEGFPAFVLLFNTFFCLMAVLLLELLLRGLRGATGRGGWAAAAGLAGRVWLNLRAQGWALFRIVGGFVALFMVVRVARHFARDAIESVATLNRTLVYVLLFALFSPLARFFARPAVFYGAVAAIVAYAVYAFGFSDDPSLRSALVQIGWMSLSIVVLGSLYGTYSNHADVHEIPVGAVRPGMLLSPPFARQLAENSRFNNERMGTQGPDGLTPHQVETLQTWYARHDPLGDEAPVAIATTVPFAPAMLLAVLATVLLRGYVLEIG